MEFEEYINEVTRKTIQEGGSASKPSSCIFLPIQDLWCFPKYPAKTSIFPPHINLAEELKNFIEKNITFLDEEDCWLGTWVNPQTGEYYLDISTGIENLEAARSFAIQAGQKDGREIVAMFNPRQRHTIFLKSV
ncbi:MAG TPA: hypothetical protein PLQ75_09120 [Anaerolineales bacterium]|nr:hypothetical protein [Anaerolineales bacterium]